MRNVYYTTMEFAFSLIDEHLHKVILIQMALVVLRWNPPRANALSLYHQTILLNSVHSSCNLTF